MIILATLLNYKSIANTELNHEPYEWGLTAKTFSDEIVAKELAEAFPEDRYSHFTRHSTAKNYNTYGRFLIKMGHQEIFEPKLQPLIWKELAEELLGEKYLDAVETATGLRNLADYNLEAVYWRLPPGCVLDPHLDSPLKLLSHIYYFNESWDPLNGGNLRILNSHRIEDCVYEIPPKLNTSVLLVRSRKSWHGYKKITGNIVRKALQISICKCAAV